MNSNIIELLLEYTQILMEDDRYDDAYEVLTLATQINRGDYERY